VHAAVNIKVSVERSTVTLGVNDIALKQERQQHNHWEWWLNTQKHCHICNVRYY